MIMLKSFNIQKLNFQLVVITPRQFKVLLWHLCALFV